MRRIDMDTIVTLQEASGSMGVAAELLASIVGSEEPQAARVWFACGLLLGMPRLTDAAAVRVAREAAQGACVGGNRSLLVQAPEECRWLPARPETMPIAPFAWISVDRCATQFAEDLETYRRTTGRRLN